MKESYPYIVLPLKVEKIKSEGIPLPPLPQLLAVPEEVKRKYTGTLIFIISLSLFFILNYFSRPGYIFYIYISFFVALISLVATIFEFVQYGKLKKQFIVDLKLYNENKEAYKKIKVSHEKIIKSNKDENLIKKYQQEKIAEFFNNSFDSVNAIKNEYSLAKKRFKLFLEEYFPDEVLDNVRIIHSAKNLEYVPDFIIKFTNPKLNVAIEIEEPYSLSNIPENIQKDYDAKDRIRQRFTNELGWIVIVFSEEQAIKNPVESCKYVEESTRYIFNNIQSGEQFANIQSIKKQKMLTGEERAHMKSTGYREKYLIEAGLMEGTDISDKFDSSKNPETKKTNGNIIKEYSENEQMHTDDIPESKSEIDEMKTPEDKKESIENEQLLLIKKVAKKMKPEEAQIKEKLEEPVKFKTEELHEVEKVQEKVEVHVGKMPNEIKISKIEQATDIIRNEEIKEKVLVNESNENQKLKMSEKKIELRHEADILKDLYSALDRHNKRQQERKEKRHKERFGQSINNKNIELYDEQKTIDEPELLIKEEIHVEKTEELTENLVSSDSNIDNPIGNQLEEEIKEENKLVEKSEELTENLVSSDSNIDNPIGNQLEEEIKEENKLVEKSEEIQNHLDLDALKNTELIEQYREKIEGAVFDKSWDELISICNEAIESLPFWDWAYYRRSTAWGNKREFEKVIEDCNKAVSYNPALADAYYNRGTAKYFTGKYRESADDYQKSIVLDYVKKADAFFNRGLCFQKMDYHKKAYLEFMKAKEMGSKKAEEIIKSQYE
jgi:hypothetical protein